MRAGVFDIALANRASCCRVHPMYAQNDPFLEPILKPWIPAEMTTPPKLDAETLTASIEPRYALLINPFYPKDANAKLRETCADPHAGSHQLCRDYSRPLAREYWDENLLHGRPPYDPLPQVVGITVHLTFSRRAYDLADWYRKRGAKVVLGGLHVLSCPDECAPHADALALGDGVQLWPTILRDAEAGRLNPVTAPLMKTSTPTIPLPVAPSCPDRVS